MSITLNISKLWSPVADRTLTILFRMVSKLLPLSQILLRMLNLTPSNRTDPLNGNSSSNLFLKMIKSKINFIWRMKDKTRKRTLSQYRRMELVTSFRMLFRTKMWMLNSSKCLLKSSERPFKKLKRWNHHKRNWILSVNQMKLGETRFNHPWSKKLERHRMAKPGDLSRLKFAISKLSTWSKRWRTKSQSYWLEGMMTTSTSLPSYATKTWTRATEWSISKVEAASNLSASSKIYCNIDQSIIDDKLNEHSKKM